MVTWRRWGTAKNLHRGKWENVVSSDCLYQVCPPFPGLLSTMEHVSMTSGPTYLHLYLSSSSDANRREEARCGPGCSGPMEPPPRQPTYTKGCVKSRWPQSKSKPTYPQQHAPPHSIGCLFFNPGKLPKLSVQPIK